MKPYYFVNQNEQQAGPIQPSEFPAYGITAQTLVWCDGMGDWAPAGSIAELRPYLSQGRAPQSPPVYGYGNRGYGNDIGARPSTNMVWAILTTLLCCLPFGIIAIVYASKVDTFWAMGNYDEARNASRKAANWSIAAAVVSLISSCIVAVFYGAMIAAML